jgi:hypothetical protein
MSRSDRNPLSTPGPSAGTITVVRRPDRRQLGDRRQHFRGGRRAADQLVTRETAPARKTRDADESLLSSEIGYCH